MVFVAMTQYCCHCAEAQRTHQRIDEAVFQTAGPWPMVEICFSIEEEVTVYFKRFSVPLQQPNSFPSVFIRLYCDIQFLFPFRGQPSPCPDLELSDQEPYLSSVGLQNPAYTPDLGAQQKYWLNSFIHTFIPRDNRHRHCSRH